jgi:hypothetical protein
LWIMRRNAYFGGKSATIPEDVSEVLVCYALGVYKTQSNPQANRVIA